ncbi:Methyltransferase-like protein 13 [Mactra antiquata]
MNLLPKGHQDFVKAEYWESFFKKRGTKAFEWYGEYPQLCGVLHKYVKTQDKILMVGCGNSQLSADMYDVGYHHITNIDISDTAIRQMTEKNQDRSDMKFLKMDVLNMEFSASDFSVVIDKGTLDALMVDNSHKVVGDVEKMFSEIDRVLKLMGRYVCISLLQEHILHKIVHFFSERGWAVRIHRIQTEDSDSKKDFQMPVFALIFTKFKPNPKLPQILEMCTIEDKNDRFPKVDDLINAVKEIQYYSVLRQRISTKKVTDDQLSLSLYNNDTSTPRYTLYIVDSESKMSNKFAIFIVPQGRETEWMFSSTAGRKQLSESANFERLIVVALDRNHTYTNLDAIQAELSGKVMELAPPDYKTGTKVPFLSLGNDIGSRNICEQGNSKMSGDYIVEEVEGHGGVIFRRLVFLANQRIVQSETRLISGSKKKKGKGKQLYVTVDKSYLACQHHISMVAGLAWVQSEQFSTLIGSSMSILVLGLGGGGLPTFIHQVFPQITLNVVDIDPDIVTIATKWFGFTPDDKLKVQIDDGLKYIQKQKDIKRHVIMIDVDSKDVTAGISCPPKPFVEVNFLQDVKDSLYPGGVLILNLVCRDKDLKKTVISTLKSLFKNVFINAIEYEVNEIVFAVNSPDDVTDADFKKNCQYLNKCVKKNVTSGEVDLSELFDKMSIPDG